MTGESVDPKSVLRAEARLRLATMSAGQAAEASRAICERLAGIVTYPAMVFLSLPGEPDLTGLIEGAIARGQVVCAPRTNWHQRTMEAARIVSLADDIVMGRHSVREPRPDAPVVAVEELSAVLVPGLGFDRMGGRLGRSAGFYDRFLGRAGLRARRIGVAFDAGILDRVPMDPWDVPMDLIVTESEVIRVRR